MAVFAVTYVYGPDTDTRMSVRPSHREWQGRLNAEGVLLASGPLEDELGPGGLLIVRADSKEAVAALLTQDPFHDAGVIEETIIRGWNPVFGPFSG